MYSNIKALFFAASLFVAPAITAQAADRGKVDAYLSAMMPADVVAAGLPDRGALLQVWKRTGKFDGVPDKDLNALSEDFLRLYEPVYVPRLRQAFAERFMSEFSNDDIDNLTACNVRRECEVAMADASLVARARNLAVFGQREGSKIGSQVGTEITPQLINIVQANRDGRFEQTEALIAGLRAGAAQ